MHFGQRQVLIKEKLDVDASLVFTVIVVAPIANIHQLEELAVFHPEAAAFQRLLPQLLQRPPIRTAQGDTQALFPHLDLNFTLIPLALVAQAKGLVCIERLADVGGEGRLVVADVGGEGFAFLW